MNNMKQMFITQIFERHDFLEYNTSRCPLISTQVFNHVIKFEDYSTDHNHRYCSNFIHKAVFQHSHIVRFYSIPNTHLNL